MDNAIGLAPLKLHNHRDGFFFEKNAEGLVRLNFGPSAKALLAAHRRSATALAREGVNVILDEVLAMPDMRSLWLEALKGYEVWFVGVHCALEELERRELARGDRHIGQARGQFGKVHQGMVYDIEVDTTNTSSQIVCESIIAQMRTKARPISVATCFLHVQNS